MELNYPRIGFSLIFYIFGNNLGLIDICYSKLRKNLEVDLDDPFITNYFDENKGLICLLYTSPSPRDRQKSRMPSSA